MVGLLLFPIPALFAVEANANWLARSWQTEEGLADNSVNGVAQTADGYLWVGTPSGLARFDGLQFENISLTNVISLPNRGITTMLHGRHGGLWLAMDRGAVVRLSGSTSRAFVTNLPTLNPNNMAEDAGGNIWIAYRSGPVFYIKGNDAKPFTEKQGLPLGPDICALAADIRGRVWYAKAGQVGVISNGLFHALFHLDPEPMRLAAAEDGKMWVCCGFRLYKCDDQGNIQDHGEFQPEGSGNVATVMLEDRQNNVWIGTSYSGLYCYNTQSGFQAVTASRLGILSLMEDREGNIWVGTDGGGLSRLRRPAITLEGAETGLPFPAVLSICQALDGTIWAVTQNGVLAHRIGDRWSSIPVSKDWPGEATCVAADAQGAVWIGTRQRGVYCWRDGKFVDWDGASTTRGLTFHTLLSDKSGNLWLGQEQPSAILRVRDGKFTTYSISQANRIVRAMVEDAAGNIWIGTSRGNLLRISGEKMTDATPRPAEDLAPIRSLYATPDGALWIGYAGWGVGRLQGGNYIEVNSSEGLFDDSISHIVADNQGWLWFGANRGIFKVRQQDFEDIAAGRSLRVRSVHYGRGEGLPSLQGTFGDSPDVLRSRDGRLWIPMKTALLVVDPAKLFEKMEAPQTLLTRISVDDRTVAQYYGILPRQQNQEDAILELNAKRAVLPLTPGHNIGFEFVAFNFSAPENVEYRHRLADVESDWVDSGTLRTVTYDQLGSGKFEFQVTARNGDGDWSQNITSIGLDIAPFFWERWWFRLAAVAAFTLAVIAIVRYVSFRRLRAQLRVLEQQAALQRERARIAKDIHDDLGANLTQIAYLGELANQDRGEPNLVGERIGKISATARQTVKSLDEIVWAVNPRNDTLAHLLDYAGQFTLDYLRTAGIRCRLDFPTEVPPRELSTDLRHNLFLVIKEALHNIFKHANASEVWLRATVSEEALEMLIEDNGRGFTAAPDDALADGLRNMKQRMAEIGGTFRVESQPGSGTKIFLRLPWPKSA